MYEYIQGRIAELTPAYVVIDNGGIGYEYCGTGVGFTFYPHRNIGVFANDGVFFAGPSYMVGLKARYITSSNIDPYVSFHYGYSGSVAVTDEDGHIDSNRSKVFKHPNVGLGIDIHTRTIISMTLGLSTSSAHSDIVSTNLKPMDTISATVLFCPSE